MQVLLIFDMSPEDLKIFKFENPTEDELRVLTDCHLKMINSVDDGSYDAETYDFLTALAEGNLDDRLFMHAESLDPKLSDFKSVEGETRIIIAGFIL